MRANPYTSNMRQIDNSCSRWNCNAAAPQQSDTKSVSRKKRITIRWKVLSILAQSFTQTCHIALERQSDRLRALNWYFLSLFNWFELSFYSSYMKIWKWSVAHWKWRFKVGVQKHLTPNVERTFLANNSIEFLWTIEFAVKLKNAIFNSVFHSIIFELELEFPKTLYIIGIL